MTHATHRSRRKGIAVSISIIAIAAVVVAFVVFQVAPSPLTPSSAAALDRLAQVAGDQPPPVLGAGQWLHSTYGASVDVSLFRNGGTQAPDSTATVPVTFGVWVSTDRTCWRQLSEPRDSPRPSISKLGRRQTWPCSPTSTTHPYA